MTVAEARTFTCCARERTARIIVVAAADVVVLSRPGAVGVTSTGWLVLGGTALFIAGHAAFKFAVWRVVPWTRLAAIVVLGLLGLAVPALPALGLGLCAAVVVLAVAALDYRAHPREATEGASVDTG